MPATTPETRCRVFGCVGRAEAQRVEAGDRPRAHGEDVAQDAADAGRRALIGLDVARVVVALHLEHAGQPVADVDDAGVLARPLDDPWRPWSAACADGLCEDLYEQCSFHIAEKMPSSVSVGVAADEVEEALVFVRLEPVLGDEFRRDLRRVAHRPIRPSCCLAQSLGETCEQAAAVGAPTSFDVVFGMRHHAEHVAALVDDAGDGVGRAVDVPASSRAPSGAT